MKFQIISFGIQLSHESVFQTNAETSLRRALNLGIPDLLLPSREYGNIVYIYMYI